MALVKTRKTVIVKHSYGTDTSGVFTFPFNIGFSADDVIVKSWTCNGTPGGGGAPVLVMIMDGVGELFHFEPTFSAVPKNIFNIQRQLSGLHTFRVVTAANVAYNMAATQIAFVLEFIEFHK